MAVVAAGGALAGCARVETILREPPTTPEQWCVARPCVHLGGTVLDEPLGTLLVFALAALWLGAGVHTWRIRSSQRSRAWFAVALALGGVGAALAGTSFQAFGYELKCAGRPLCVWTNWFEVAYLIAQAASVSAMVAAVAYACTAGSFRRVILVYAAASALLYAALAVAGALVPIAVLISFDVFVAFAGPALLLVLAIGAFRARHHRDALGRALVVATLWLVLTFTAFYAYGAADLTRALWNGGTGFYFSENDVLHTGMIVWLAYAATVVARHLRDSPESASKNVSTRQSRP